MDHVSGFDSIFRLNYDRDPPFLIVGPKDTNRAITHRLRGYTWNLVEDAKGAVEIREYVDGTLHREIYPTVGQFESASVNETFVSDGTVFQSPDVTVTMIELDHGCISAGYVVRESDRQNVDIAKVTELNLSPGPWLKKVTDPNCPATEMITINERDFQVGRLRDAILVTKSGDSLAYLTDFRATGEAFEKLVEFVRDVDVVICENNYRDEELELATRHHHLTSTEVGSIAAAANVGKLVLFHLSDRYIAEDWQDQIEEVRKVFPEVYWPDSWTDMN